MPNPHEGIESDTVLLQSLKEGSAQAFSMLVDRYAQRFYKVAYRLCGTREDAEDVVQASFLKLWENPSRFMPERGAQFTTWFTRVVVNAALDRKRARGWLKGEVTEMMEDASPGPEQNFAKAQGIDRMSRAVMQLPDNQRAAVVLWCYEEMSNSDAAKAMGLKLKAYQSLLMRAKTALKKEYAGKV